MSGVEPQLEVMLDWALENETEIRQVEGYAQVVARQHEWVSQCREVLCVKRSGKIGEVCTEERV